MLGAADPPTPGLRRRPSRRRQVAPLGYAGMVASVAAQLDVRRLQDEVPPDLLVVLPVVGFGAQSAAVVPDAVALLTAAVVGASAVLALVNRPVSRAADGTGRWLREWARRHPQAPLLVAELTLPQRPRLGELRQVAVDALELAVGPMPAYGRVVLADDDVVGLPVGTYERLGRVLDTAALATGPVLFDSPQMPICLLPELWLGDLFRALLVDRQFARLERAPGSVATAAIESLVLSTHLGARRDLLHSVGGFHDLNELTELVRDSLATSMPTGLPAVRRSAPLDAVGSGDPVHELLGRAARVHARRALAAYAAAGVPTVAQWRAARLRTSTVDPVRVSTPAWPGRQPLSRLSQGARREAIADLGRHLGIVLDHVQPPYGDAVGALAQLGLAADEIDLAAPGPGERWRLQVRDSSGLLERAAELQLVELQRLEEPPAARAGAR